MYCLYCDNLRQNFNNVLVHSLRQQAKWVVTSEFGNADQNAADVICERIGHILYKSLVTLKNRNVNTGHEH